MNIILISGKQGSGKTTTSKLLLDCLSNEKEYYVESFKLAYPIYEAVKKIKEYEIQTVTDDDYAELMVDIGNDWGRRIDPLLWVKILCFRIKKFYRTTEENKIIFNINYNVNDTIIIDDWRYPNEYDYLKEQFPEANIIRVRLECPTEVRKLRAQKWRDENTESETSLDKYPNFDLLFSTSKETTVEIVDEIINKLKEITQ